MTAANGLTASSTQFVPGGLRDGGWTALADFAAGQRHDLERTELGRHSV